jgi:hypothetical protein
LTGIVAGLSVALLAAGLVASVVRRKIAALGGRPVLAVGAALMTFGLAVIALSPNLIVISWPGRLQAVAWGPASTIPRTN